MMKYKAILLLLFYSVLCLQCKKDKPTPKTIVTLSTSDISNITNNTALTGGTVTVTGQAVKARGVCWSTSNNPTINDNKTTDSTGATSFVSKLVNLNANTTYYAKAYVLLADNSIVYGDAKSFLTTDYYVSFNVDSVPKYDDIQDSINVISNFNIVYRYYTTTITVADGGSAAYSLALTLITPALPKTDTTYSLIPDNNGTNFINEATYQYKNPSFQGGEAKYISSRLIPYNGQSVSFITINAITPTSIKGTFYVGAMSTISSRYTILIDSGKFYLPYNP